MSHSWPWLTSTVTSQFYGAIMLHREAYAPGRWGILKHAVTKAPLFTLYTFIVAECIRVGSDFVTSNGKPADVHFSIYQDARRVCTQMQMSACSCLCMSEDNFCCSSSDATYLGLLVLLFAWLRHGLLLIRNSLKKLPGWLGCTRIHCFCLPVHVITSAKWCMFVSRHKYSALRLRKVVGFALFWVICFMVLVAIARNLMDRESWDWESRQKLQWEECKSVNLLLIWCEFILLFFQIFGLKINRIWELFFN